MEQVLNPPTEEELQAKMDAETAEARAAGMIIVDEELGEKLMAYALEQDEVVLERLGEEIDAIIDAQQPQ